MTAREVAEKLLSDLGNGQEHDFDLVEAITAELESRDEAITAWKQTADMFCKAHEKAKEQIAAQREELLGAQAVLAAMIESAECRGDEDCDHCIAVGQLEDIDVALNADSGDVK